MKGKEEMLLQSPCLLFFIFRLLSLHWHLFWDPWPHPTSCMLCNTTVMVVALLHSSQHVEVPIPTPKKDEILLKLEASSLNPADWKIQKGMIRPFLPSRFPFVPVTDVAGEVVEIGPGVQGFKVGDKVVSKLKLLRGGGLAEYAVATTELTVKRPPEVTSAEAAGIPIAGLTALRALTKAGIKLDGSGPSADILITAASGGVGHYAVQLAKLGNAHVTATCGARNINLVKSLGADEVLDYKTPEGESLKSPSGRKYDYIIHCATGIRWSTFEACLSERGKVIDITSPTAMLTSVIKKMTFSKKSLVPLVLNPKGGDLEFMVELFKEGKLRTVIDSIFPLAKAEEAWAKSMDGHATGKIIVTLE
ncbi:chloroplast envelope quinone oxidoreductase homolog isoform X1 [Nymphaea colorata]|nr:chloroplast envelope quinone oxidoreductase homolog isoform X1 [Nymphaea colorata]